MQAFERHWKAALARKDKVEAPPPDRGFFDPNQR